MGHRTVLAIGCAVAAGAALLAGCSTTGSTQHMSPTRTITPTSTPIPTGTGTPNLSTSDKSVAPQGTVYPGTVLHYYLAISNTGGSPAMNVAVTDSLPGGVDPATVVFIAGPAGSVLGGTISWNIASLAPGTLTLHFSVAVSATASAGSTLTNTGVVIAANLSGVTTLGPVSNPVGALTSTPMPTDTTTRTFTHTSTACATSTATGTATVAPNLAGSSKTGPAGGVVPNGDAHFYIQVVNSGGSPALNVTVTDTLASQLDPATLVYWSGPAGSLAGSVITWNLGTLAGGASVTLHFSAAVMGGITVGTVVCNSATVSASNAGSVGVGPVCFPIVPPSSTFTPTPFGFSSMTFTISSTITPTFTPTVFVPTSTFTPTFVSASVFAILSGRNALTTPMPDVYAATSGGGGILSAWQMNANVLAVGASRQAGAIAYNGYVYYAGGLTFGAAPMTNVYSAVVAGTTVSSFTNVGAFPAVGREFGYCRNGAQFYVFGGSPAAGTYLSTTYVATMGGGGTIGAFTTMAPLPAGNAWCPAVTDGNYVWLSGGIVGGVEVPTVYVGTISGGVVTSWSTTNPLPVGLQGQRATIVGGTIFVVGGSSLGTRVSTVYQGAISGPNVTWTAVAPLPQGMSFHAGPVFANGYLHVATGGLGGLAESNVSYSAPWSGAVLGSWFANTVVPATLSAASGAGW